MYDTIIIGAGCAGMTAALYCARAGKNVLLLESENFGGQITFSPRVENYPGIKSISGSEFADNLFEQVISAGVKSELEEVKKIKDNREFKTVITEYAEYETKTLIIATGVKHRTLGIENEEFLIGKGVSYCAVCDGAFFKDKQVAVVGGGNTALEDAAFLSAYCKKVFLIHRRDEFRGEENLYNDLKLKSNVEFVLNSVVSELIGDSSLGAIKIHNKATGEYSLIDAEGLFIAVGQIPNNDIFKEMVALDENGFIIAAEDCKTSAEGIFAAGDCRTKEIRQLTTAAADGATAALAASKYIK